MRDQDVRQKLRDTYLVEHYLNPNTRVVEEMSLSGGINRIDIAVVNGSLHGLEIKSDKDTLDRLPAQMQTYLKVFDFVTVVCGEKHTDHVLDSVPSFVGIIEAKVSKAGLSLQELRPALQNCEQSVEAMLDLLWNEELQLVLDQLDIAKGNSSKTKQRKIQAAVPYLEPRVASQYVRDLIKMREDWRERQLHGECDDSPRF
jgi:hypothetical protein